MTPSNFLVFNNPIAKTNRSKCISFFKTLWMMYILFPFRLKGISFVQNAFYYGVTFICVFIFFKKLLNKKIKKKLFYPFFYYLTIFAFLILLSVLVPFFKHTYDYSYLSNYLYYLGRIVILTGSVLLCDNVNGYLKLTVKAINLYVLFSFLLLIRPLHNFYSTILDSSSLSSNRFGELYSQNYYTRFGLQGFSGFGCTIMCSIGVLYCCLLFIEAAKNHKRVYTLLFQLLICIIGTLMYGRSGFLISFVLVVLTLVYLAVRYNKFQVLLLSSLFLFFLSCVFIINEKYFEQISWMHWMFEGFFNYIDYGTFSTSSSDQLQNMFIKPTLSTFFKGDGYYTVAGAYYMRTDVGFLRPLFFWGIFGEILYYSLLIPEFYSLKFSFGKMDYLFVEILFLVFIVLFEFKGEVLLTFSTMLYALMCINLLTKSSNTNNTNT